MSSPNLNNAIILGCVLNYTSVLLFGLDGGIVDYGYDIVCASRTWTLSLGFSLAYGAMFSKTWRVHSIFTNRKLRRKVVKDHHLFVVVLLLVIVDVVYLTVWQLVDPLRSIVRDSNAEALSSSSLDVVVVMQLRHCESVETYRWLGILCGYKGVLLLFGAFLAWETRRVSIPALNDSKYIGMSVYNVFILCVIGAPMSLVMREQPDASFSIVSISIVFCTSITLCLVFIPKVLELRRFMAVGGQPDNIYTSNNLGRTNLHDTIGTVDTDMSRQLNECRKKLAESESVVQDLRRRLRSFEDTERTESNINISESTATDNNILTVEGNKYVADESQNSVQVEKD